MNGFTCIFSQKSSSVTWFSSSSFLNLTPMGYTGKGREWIKEQMGWEVEIVRHPWSGMRGVWAPKNAVIN